MSVVFISYRRADRPHAVDRLVEVLERRLGRERIYRDIDDIPLGADYREHLTSALRDSDYVLVAIGPEWLLLADEQGRRRLEDPNDPVRQEVRTAIELGSPTIPVLIDGVPMPAAEDLPEDIRRLHFLNGVKLRPSPDFEHDVERLSRALEKKPGSRAAKIRKQSLPAPFSAWFLARQAATGGGLGLAAAGFAIGLAGQKNLAAGLVGAFAGLLAGALGALVAGLLTGAVLRRLAPPLLANELRRLGATWALGIVGLGVVSTALGLWLAEGSLSGAGGAAAAGSTPEEILGSCVAAVVGALVLFVLVLLAGLTVGAGLMAAYVARRFRLGPGEIGRGRALLIGVAWFLGGLLAILAFFGLLGQLAG